MSNLFIIQLPKLGESIHSAVVVQWMKKAGDAVALDEALLEVSTDKVNSEIPSPVAGVLEEIFAEVNQEVEVGYALATIRTGPAPILTDEANLDIERDHNEGNSSDQTSPAVLNLLRQRNIPLTALDKIKGTGGGGRITKKDVEGYKETLQEPLILSSDSTVSRIKIMGLRKQIADNMIRAYREIPHAALITDIDVTDLLEEISQLKKQGTKITITSFVVKAMAKAIVDYPLLNASVEDEYMIIKHAVNIGIAVGIEHGVIVPVVRHTERKTLKQIAEEVVLLSARARNGELHNEDVKEGTITLTNFGMTGIRSGLPIIRYPECAILGMGAIIKKPVVIEDRIVIRSIIEITVSFDHRLLDGIYGCGFISKIKELLESPSLLSEGLNAK
ncbi:MAG: dihydrolipoamide acetyltransferase family protein [Chlamydiae bacterium]|nr:dihydrolipoamide acetyltransferase family protein [Chlamydiota bacterium]